MAPALYDTISVDIAALPKREYPTLSPDQAVALASQLDTPDYLFRASGSRVRFAGFLSVYEEGRDENGKSGPPASREVTASQAATARTGTAATTARWAPGCLR